MALLPAIGAKLESLGYGTLQIDMFLDELPDTPDAAIAIVDTGGETPDMNFCGIDTENAGVQVLVRGAQHDAVIPRNTIYGIFRDLTTNFKNEFVGGVFYLECRPQQSPFKLEVDLNERLVMAVNFIVVKEIDT